MSESLRDIRLFVAAYEERSFTAAATRENATQSGVSQHIHKLEDRFGVQLFSRQPGSTMPTPAGDSYYRHCVQLLRVYENSRNDMKRFSKGLSGEIVVGLMPTMTRCVLGPALATFVAENPNAQVRVVDGYSALLTEGVRAGQYAFAIVPAFQGGPGLNMRLFQSTPEVLVSSRTSGLKHMEPVRLTELDRLKLVLPSPQNTRRRTIENRLDGCGVAIQGILELDSMFGTLDLVANTDWFSILPGIMMASDIDPELFSVNPIIEPEMKLDLVLIEPMRLPLGVLGETFLGLLEDQTRRANERWTLPMDLVQPAGAWSV